MHELNEEVAAAMIKFMYTGCYCAPSDPNHDEESPRDLSFHIAMYSAADQYQVHDLKATAVARYRRLISSRCRRTLTTAQEEELSEGFCAAVILTSETWSNDFSKGIGRCLVEVSRECLLESPASARIVREAFCAVKELAFEVANDMTKRSVRAEVLDDLTEIQCTHLDDHMFLTQFDDVGWFHSGEGMIYCPLCAKNDLEHPLVCTAGKKRKTRKW